MFLYNSVLIILDKKTKVICDGDWWEYETIESSCRTISIHDADLK